ncbi:ABC transporter substrate-binding protein [Candidatus Jidaibacter acanthamoebae]|nr:ABC transporter substrate-binding protein [Candidatus Jidaibacter acanthamoeba]
MKKKLVILVLGLLSITLIMCLNPFAKHDNIDKDIKKTLVMGVSLDYPPFEFMHLGKPQGFDIDLAYMLANELDFKLEIKDMDFGSLIPALNSKQIDFIISAMSPSPERARNVDFTKLYYQAKIEILTLDSKDTEAVSRFENKKIGVQMGSTMETYLKKKQAGIPSLEILSIARVPALIEELKIGRIDGVLLDAEIARKIISKNPNLKSKVIEDFIGGNAVVLPLKSELTKAFNYALDNLEKEGKLRSLEQKWIVESKE